MPESTLFRAALHGYNREDVVNYIDRMSREHEDLVRRLEERNEAYRAELERANEALAAAEQNDELEKALSDAQALAADLRARNGELEDRVRELEEALEQARSAPETETIPTKDYTELELAAYRRAELAERLARERSDDIYRQIQSVFEQANAKLAAGRADLENLSRTLTSDVNEMLTLLTSLNGAYRQAETSFAEIDAKNRRFAEE